MNTAEVQPHLENAPTVEAKHRRFLADQRHLLDDDLWAAESVCGVLVAVVTIGLVLMVATVLLVLMGS